MREQRQRGRRWAMREKGQNMCHDVACGASRGVGRYLGGEIDSSLSLQAC